MIDRNIHLHVYVDPIMNRVPVKNSRFSAKRDVGVSGLSHLPEDPKPVS